MAVACASFFLNLLGSLAVPTKEIAPGVNMPMLALGTAPASVAKECSARDAVEQYLRLGGRHIDTAEVYGTQKEVGMAMKAAGIPRSETYLCLRCFLFFFKAFFNRSIPLMELFSFKAP